VGVGRARRDGGREYSGVLHMWEIRQGILTAEEQQLGGGRDKDSGGRVEEKDY